MKPCFWSALAAGTNAFKASSSGGSHSHEDDHDRGCNQNHWPDFRIRSHEQRYSRVTNHHPLAWWWPILCDPLFFNVSLWQCLANASQASFPWVKPAGSCLVCVDGRCMFCVSPLSRWSFALLKISARSQASPLVTICKWLLSLLLEPSFYLTWLSFLRSFLLTNCLDNELINKF